MMKTQLDNVAASRGVRKKGLKGSTAKESSAEAGVSSRPKKSGGEEETERVFIVKGIQIKRKDLLDRKHMTRDQAADDFKFCVASLKKARKFFGYPSWPPVETDNNASSTCDVENVNEEEKEVVTKKRKKVNTSCSTSNLSTA